MKNKTYIIFTFLLLVSYSGLYSQAPSNGFPLDLRKLGSFDSIVVSFQATVAQDMPIELTDVDCQTQVTAGGGVIAVLSDDPRTAAPGDPTLVEIAIPTMSQWGIIILGLLLVNLAVLGIYEKRKPIFIKSKV